MKTPGEHDEQGCAEARNHHRLKSIPHTLPESD